MLLSRSSMDVQSFLYYVIVKAHKRLKFELFFFIWDKTVCKVLTCIAFDKVTNGLTYVTRSHQTSLNSQIPNAATARNSSGGQFGFFFFFLELCSINNKL